MVIIGAGHGGFTLAGALRAAGVDGPVTLIDGQIGLPYQRPPLSKAYLLEAGARLAFRPESYYARQRIDLVTGDPVVEVDRVSRTIRLRSGQERGYRHLVLATGARARPLPAPGSGLDGVVTLRTRKDADTLRPLLEKARRPVVVGGGFVGLEFAAVAAARGRAATIVEATERLLGRSVSAPTAHHLARAHHCWGTTVLLGSRVRRLEGDAGRVRGVVLDDARTLPADLVVVGVGAQPDTALAEAAGLEVDDGVVVDPYLHTRDPAVSAIGDCARVGAARRLESVQNATDQARALARTIAGEPTTVTTAPWFWSEQHEITLQMAGDLTGHDETVVRGEADAFSTHCYRAGRLVAVESVNRPADHVAARVLLAPQRATQ